ncbi:MAG: PH domain-containing protein [Actinomycetota bacterium]
MIDLAIPQRQSPLAVVFLGLRTLRNVGLAQFAIIVLFVVRGPFAGSLIVVPLLLVVVLVAVSTLAWWRYTFQLIDGELVVHKGIVRLDRLTVPLDRIQSLAIEQELLHRLTGLVKVAVDTAGSSEAEFTIDAIPRPIAEELERQALDAGPSATAEEPPDARTAVDPALHGGVVAQHDGGRLLVAALTASPLAGLVVLGPLIAALGQFGDDVPVDASVDPGGFRWWWVPAVIAAAAMFSALLNIGRVVLQDWGLTLRSSSTGLRRTSGLLSRTSSASSFARVQVLTTAQNPAQRRAGIHDIELSTIGEGDLALVGCDDQQIDEIRALLDTATGAELQLDRRIHPAEVWLAVRNTTVLAAIGATAAAIGIEWWAGALVLLVVPWVWWSRRRHVRNFRWGLGAELVSSERVLSGSTAQAPLHKANSVAVTQTIFERRRGLATLRLATAAGSVAVGMIPLAEAEAARDVILHAAETDQRPWM